MKTLCEDIKNLSDWDQAYRWLAKHGWGSALIEEQHVLWLKAHAPKVKIPTKEPSA